MAENRRRCQSYLIGNPGKKYRVVIDDSMDMQALKGILASKFNLEGGPAAVMEVRDEEGCIIEHVADIFAKDVLVAVPVGYKAEVEESKSSAVTPVPAASATVASSDEVVELQMLTTSLAEHFEVIRKVGGGQNGMVFAALCSRRGLPKPNKTYAMKLVFNFGINTKTGDNAFEREYMVLSQLPPHPNVMRFWAAFWDRIPDEMIPHLPGFVREQADYSDSSGQLHRRKAQFIIGDYHPQSLQKHLQHLRKPLPFRTALEFTVDLLRGVSHMEKFCVAHLDLKPDNILVAFDSRLVICDFGTAMRFDSRAMACDYRQGLAPGGNQLHLAPEVLNGFNEAQRSSGARRVSYAKQAIWAIGVLVHEMVLRSPPFPDYPNQCRSHSNHHISFTAADVPQLPNDYPGEFRALVNSMLRFDPAERVSCTDALAVVERLKAALSPRVQLSGAGTSVITDGISVVVKSVTGQAVVVTVSKRATVYELKAAAAPRILADQPLRDVFLLFAGQKCEDTMSLEEVGVEGESCVYLIVAPTDGLGLGAGAGAETVPASGAGSAVDASAEAVPAAVTVHRNGKDLPPHFNPVHCHRALALLNRNQTVRGSLVTWGTVFVNQDPVTSGTHQWVFRVDSLLPENRGGMAIGIASTDFDTENGILGAHRDSFGFSGRTGDKGCGNGFSPYGPRYTNGDIVTVDLDMNHGTVAFSVNGVSYDVAFRHDIAGRAFYCGVCIGGVQKEGACHQATLISYTRDNPALTFRHSAHSSIMLTNNQRSARGSVREWRTVLVDEPPVTSGVHVWEFTIDKLEASYRGGMAIGVVSDEFHVADGILGASQHSWAYSGRTGDKGDGAGKFDPYGKRYATGDRITVYLDMDVGELRFSRNGQDQGIAYSGSDLMGKKMNAAVCIGGVAVDNGYHQATVVPRCAPHHKFDAAKSHRLLQLAGDRLVAIGQVKQWGTVLVEMEPVTSGKHHWEFHIDKLDPTNKGGMAIGVVSDSFDVSQGILGAHPGSWGYSGRTGDKGDGLSGFQPYGDSYSSGDTVGVHLDMDAGVLSFSLNCVTQGVAFDSGLKGLRLCPAVCIGGVHRTGGFHSVSFLCPMAARPPAPPTI